jgi:hypothetical protein
MINRRHDGRASCLARQSPQQTLERKPRIHLLATWKGGHESGQNHTDDTLGIPGFPRFRASPRVLNVRFVPLAIKVSYNERSYEED